MSLGPIDIIQKDLSRHEEQIKVIASQVNDLAVSHAEIGFLVKTYMEKIPVFEKKIDDLGDKILKLMPNRSDWEIEKRIETNEKAIIRLTKSFIFISITVLVLVMVTPEAQQFLLGVLENKVP